MTVKQPTQPADLETAWAAAARLAHAVAAESDPQLIWPVAEQVFSELIGHRLFTVLAYTAGDGLVTRTFSNRPDEYPVSGTKVMGPTPWGDIVLKQGLAYIGHNADDIRWAFPDHALIASMGLESTCNLPVRAGGETLGTINLLDHAGFYADNCLPTGLVLAGLLAPAMKLAHAQLFGDEGSRGKA
ncbi:MAG: GAF domain-containing protein [Burkholderiaceae bacterium]